MNYEYLNKIIQGDSLEKLKELEDNSIDSIVTDPPYELTSGNSKKGFMGKKWDGTGISFNVELWKECLRVLKPGGHLISLGGTRTYHRMAVAIEDAGFEIRDMLEWIYNSGFPKSHNIGKAYDKKMNNEREDLGKYLAPDGKERGGVANNPMDVANYKKGDRSEHNITKGSSQWEGFGSNLKPAHEPIVLARKKLSEKTIVENCIKHGTGALDIDGCRIPTSEDLSGLKPFGDLPEGTTDNKGWTRPWMADKNKIVEKQQEAIDKMKNSGRFPANLLVSQRINIAINDLIKAKNILKENLE